MDRIWANTWRRFFFLPRLGVQPSDVENARLAGEAALRRFAEQANRTERRLPTHDEFGYSIRATAGMSESEASKQLAKVNQRDGIRIECD